MSIIRWNNRNMLADMFNNFFDTDFDYLHHRISEPSANILEHPDSFELEIAVPGMKKEDFKINLDNNVLTISSEMEDEKMEEGKNYTRKEFYYGSFSRSFTLPRSIDTEKIKADYENGILNVHLPKKAEARLESKKEIKIS